MCFSFTNHLQVESNRTCRLFIILFSFRRVIIQPFSPISVNDVSNFFNWTTRYVSWWFASSQFAQNVLKLGMFSDSIFFLVPRLFGEKKNCFSECLFFFQSLVVRHGSPKAKIIEPNKSRKKMQQEFVSPARCAASTQNKGRMTTSPQLINHPSQIFPLSDTFFSISSI